MKGVSIKNLSCAAAHSGPAEFIPILGDFLITSLGKELPISIQSVVDVTMSTLLCL